MDRRKAMNRRQLFLSPGKALLAAFGGSWLAEQGVSGIGLLDAAVFLKDSPDTPGVGTARVLDDRAVEFPEAEVRR